MPCFLSDRILVQVREMDPQLPIMPADYTSSASYELLPFLGAKGVADLRRAILRGNRLSN